MRFDVTDRILDGGDLLGVFVGNFDSESFFERHHEFHRIERVGAEIIDERCRRRHFGFVHTELFHNNLFDLIFSRRSHSKTSLVVRPCFKQIADYRSPLKAFSSDFSSSALNIAADLSAARIKSKQAPCPGRLQQTCALLRPASTEHSPAIAPDVTPDASAHPALHRPLSIGCASTFVTTDNCKSANEHASRSGPAGLPQASAARNETARSPASRIARFAPASFARAHGAFDSFAMSGNHDLRRRIQIRGRNNLTLRSAFADRLHGRQLQTKQRRHGADSHRDGFLHVPSAPAHQRHGVAQTSALRPRQVPNILQGCGRQRNPAGCPSLRALETPQPTSSELQAACFR